MTTTATMTGTTPCTRRETSLQSPWMVTIDIDQLEAFCQDKGNLSTPVNSWIRGKMSKFFLLLTLVKFKILRGP